MGNRVTGITIFHYHLLPGGVNSVIALSAEAMARHIPELEYMTLVSGTTENTGEVAESIRTRIAGTGVTVKTAVLPDIGYVTGMASSPSVSSIKKHLRRFTGSFWWIHNYHLGKNPQFTQAILEILQEDPHQRLLFHIHDFPECARFENLQRLNTGISLNPYPQGPNVRYALINERDRQLLAQSGISPDDLFLLNNPVRKSGTDVRETPTDTEGIKKRLRTAFPDAGVYDPRGLNLFYPVRTIRRKNVLEAGVWTRLIASSRNEACNLIVTLPGVSSSERRYSGAVEKAYRDGLIPGLWGIGRRLEEAEVNFADLGRSSDLMIASSVQEGFGYLFIESLQWGLPLFARELDVLDGMDGLFDAGSSRFYRSLRIPLSPEQREELRRSYRSKLSGLDEHLPLKSRERLHRQIEEIGLYGHADLALLGVPDQIEILRNLDSPGFIKECLDLNRDELEKLSGLFGRKPAPEKVSSAEEQFSFESFARQVRNIFDSYERSETASPGSVAPEAASQERLIDAFAELRFLLLLYDYNGNS
ncbi:hypothetical protein B4O97_13885 [Marispirochaeta aestuarii]|uniref:Glycosyl transferase family 1 domain-containing protein n=1 Tax=Marispirochaeta aestuarii TaxID=1963862 RepID=A0A1Y1RVU2_9SPIO|nr:hypothetical protein [Marispirochaeta aestuarii]ORC34165.1 hypothetical protein B4O97_13885 [Marispirochaeta aestuarii]